MFLEAYNVDTDAAIRVLAGGLAGNRILDTKAAGMLAREFLPQAFGSTCTTRIWESSRAPRVRRGVVDPHLVRWLRSSSHLRGHKATVVSIIRPSCAAWNACLGGIPTNGVQPRHKIVRQRGESPARDRATYMERIQMAERYAVNCSIMLANFAHSSDPLQPSGRASTQWSSGGRSTKPFLAMPRRIHSSARSLTLGWSFIGLNFFAGDMAAGDRGLVSWPGRAKEFRDNVGVVCELGERLGCRAFNALSRQSGPLGHPSEQDDFAVENLAFAGEAVGPDLPPLCWSSPSVALRIPRCSQPTTSSGSFLAILSLVVSLQVRAVLAVFWCMT